MDDEKVDAWMPLWIGSYLADTMSLTTQQHGAYLLILFAYWRNNGPLLDDDEDLAGITKCSPAEWKKLRPKIAKFFDVADGVWSHGRADKELASAGLRKKAAVSKAKAGAEARWKKCQKDAEGDAPSIAQALHRQCPTPSPSPKDSTEDLPDPAGGRELSDVVDGFVPTPAGVVCKALRMGGIAGTNPGHPRLLALLEAGAELSEFVGFIPGALKTGSPFLWLLGAVEGERTRAASMAQQLHRGAMPNRQQAIETRNRGVADEWAEAHAGEPN